MTRARLDQLLARLEPRMAKRFRSLMQRVKSARTLAAIENALESGGPALGAILTDIEAAAGMMAAQSAAVHHLVGTEVAAQLADKLDKMISYDGSNQRAVAALQQSRIELSGGLVEKQRQAIGQALIEGARDGYNPRKTAIAIRDSIGLTADQTRWVANYRRKLEGLERGALDNALRHKGDDKAVMAAIEVGKPLPQKRIDRMVDRYAARQLKHRSEVIAQDLTLRALHQGAAEGYDQAIEAGHLDVDRVQRKWIQANRANKRDSHRPMNGQLRRVGVDFVTGNGVHMRHPHDPRAGASENAGCACGVTWRVLPPGQVAVNADRAAP